MNVDTLVTIVVAVVSSGGLWTFLQFVVGRRSEAARQEAEKENRRDERTKMLADAQAVAQQTALDSADRALASVNRRCTECVDELHKLREATGDLIDRFEFFLDDASPENRRLVRVAIKAMRLVL